MKTIPKQAWSAVHQKACDVVNATLADDDILSGVYTTQMLDLLDDLESKFGRHPMILATRADYMSDSIKRRALYDEALIIARRRGDLLEIQEITDSLKTLEEEFE